MEHLQWKSSTNLQWLLVFGLIINFAFVECQNNNSDDISVNENDERALFQYLQQQGLGLALEPTDKISDEPDIIIDGVQRISLTALALNAPLTENLDQRISLTALALNAPLTENLDMPNMFDQQVTVFQSPISNLIQNYSQFLNDQPAQFFENQTLEFQPNLERMSDMCYTNLEDYGRINFNAIGIIKMRVGERNDFCSGTLVSDEAVITTAECVKNQLAEFYFQPSWAEKHVWLPFKSFKVSQKWQNDSRYNFSVFYLEEKLSDGPRIEYEQVMIQRQQCFITLLGWRFSICNESGCHSDYKMVTCPHLPKIEQQLNIQTTNCQRCDLNDVDFATGSPLILSCHAPQITHTLIGMLQYKQLEGEKSSIPSQIFQPDKLAAPFMFTDEIFLDIFETVERSG